MMDIKDIIKWFIPCFHILRKCIIKNKLFIVFLLFCLNFSASSAVSELVNSDHSTKNVEKISLNVLVNENGSQRKFDKSYQVGMPRSLQDSSIGRTFGRPFKKMVAGLMPLIFQVGAASTWAVVAALVGVKTLLVSLVILKILLMAGAAKLGALFASKQPHHHQTWEPPHQKEIHLHIHNGHLHDPHEEHISPSWSRDYTTQEAKLGYIYEPYKSGPQTISTPYGNYMKIEPVSSTITA